MAPHTYVSIQGGTFWHITTVVAFVLINNAPHPKSCICGIYMVYKSPLYPPAFGLIAKNNELLCCKPYLSTNVWLVGLFVQLSPLCNIWPPVCHSFKLKPFMLKYFGLNGFLNYVVSTWNSENLFEMSHSHVQTALN